MKARSTLGILLGLALVLGIAWLVTRRAGAGERAESTRISASQAPLAPEAPGPEPAGAEPESLRAPVADVAPHDPEIGADAGTERPALRVLVVSAVDRRPIEGAEVVEHVETARTGPDGVALVPFPTHAVPSARSLQISAESFLPAEARAGTYATEIEIALELAVRFRGLVVDARTGSPADGIAVTVEQEPPDDSTSPLIQEQLVADEGRFESPLVRPGVPVRVRVHSRGCAPLDQSIVVAGGEEVRFELCVGGRVEGTVRRTGPTDPSMRVIAMRADSWDYGAHTKPSSPDGAFAIDGLELGHEYQVVVTSGLNTVLAASDEFSLDAANPIRRVELDVVTPPPAGLSIRVVDAEARPRPRVQLALQRLTPVGPFLDGTAGANGWTDAEGRWRNESLLAGVWRIVAMNGSYERDVQEVVVEFGRVTEVEIVAGRDPWTRTLSGSFSWTTGRPAAGARFTVEWPAVRPGESNGYNGYADDEGRFEIDRLPREPLTLRIGGADKVAIRLVREIPPDQDRLEVVLDAPCRVAGRFSPPVEQAAVDVVVLDGTEAHRLRARIEPDGAFELRFVPRSERVSLQLEVEGDVRVWIPNVRVSPGATVDLGDVAPGSGAVLEGVVVDGEGAPAAGANVAFHCDALRDERFSVSDSAGRFRFDGVPSLSCRVVAVDPELGGAGVDVPDASSASVVVLRLMPRPRLVLTLEWNRARHRGRPRIALVPGGLEPLRGTVPVRAAPDALGRIELSTTNDQLRVHAQWLGEEKCYDGPVVTLRRGETTTIHWSID